MNVIRLARWLTFVSVLLACIGYALADRIVVLGIAVLPIAALGWWLTEIKLARPLPKLVINLLVTGAVAWSFYRVAVERGTEGLTVSVFCQFLVVVLLVKLWDEKQPRDLAQILTLSIFLTIGSILTANSLGMGIALILNVVVTVVAVMSFHVAAGLERRERTLKPLRTDGLAHAPPAWQTNRLFGLLCACTLIFGIGVSVVVWLIMPRGIGEGDLGSFGQFAGRRTGFTERVDLRRSGLISESSRSVLELRLENQQGDSVGSDGRNVYLRGAVLDSYDGRAWTKSRSGPKDLDMKVQGGKPWVLRSSSSSSSNGGNLIVQKISMRDAPAANAPVFSILEPVEVTLDRDAQLSLTQSSRTLTRDGTPGRYSYTASSLTPKFDEERSQVVRTNTETFPSERIRAEASSVLNAAGIEPDPALRPPAWDFEACKAIEQHMRTSFTYTLDPKPVRLGLDPIESFLFDSRSGHCEYFAAAMTAMLRSVGIPARVVAGFVASEYSTDSEAYLVRESSAHAWVEAMVGSGVWMSFDPAPPAGLQAQIRPPVRFLAHWQRWLDSMDDLWATSVVTFDEQSRKKLLGVDTNPAPWIQQQLTDLISDYRTGDHSTLWRAVFKAIAGTAAIGLVWIGIVKTARGALERRRALRGSRDALKSDPSLLGLQSQSKFYEQALVALSRHGLPKPSWCPPADFAESIPDAPEIASALRRISALYYHLRFGRRPLTPEEQAASMTALAELRAGGRRSASPPEPPE